MPPLAEIQAIKNVPSPYKGVKATARTIASLKPKERKPIPKVSAKKKALQGEERALFQEDKAFYAEIWEASPHTCQCGCKSKLGKEPRTLYFHHLLEKEKFPQFRHVPENIMLLATDCHQAVHASISNRPEVERRRKASLKLLLK